MIDIIKWEYKIFLCGILEIRAGVPRLSGFRFAVNHRDIVVKVYDSEDKDGDTGGIRIDGTYSVLSQHPGHLIREFNFRKLCDQMKSRRVPGDGVLPREIMNQRLFYESPA